MDNLITCPTQAGIRYLAWLLIKCPQSDEEVVSRITQPVKFANSWASWWQCPACGGWHVTMFEDWKNLRQELKYSYELVREV